MKAIHNEVIARIARLASAPRDQEAGIYVFKRIGDPVKRSEPLLRVHAQSEQPLEFGLKFWEEHRDAVEVG